MGLMPIVAAESGLFNALSSETLALSAVAASSVAQYMSKRAKTNPPRARGPGGLHPRRSRSPVRVDSNSEGEQALLAWGAHET